MAKIACHVLKKLRTEIPGYLGYEEPEDRRATDRHIRRWLADRLQHESQSLERLWSPIRSDETEHARAFFAALDGQLRNLRSAETALREGEAGADGFLRGHVLDDSTVDPVRHRDAEIVSMMRDIRDENWIFHQSDDWPEDMLRISNMVLELERLIRERDRLLVELGQ